MMFTLAMFGLVLVKCNEAERGKCMETTGTFVLATRAIFTHAF